MATEGKQCNRDKTDDSGPERLGSMHDKGEGGGVIVCHTEEHQRIYDHEVPCPHACLNGCSNRYDSKGKCQKGYFDRKIRSKTEGVEWDIHL